MYALISTGESFNIFEINAGGDPSFHDEVRCTSHYSTESTKELINETLKTSLKTACKEQHRCTDQSKSRAQKRYSTCIVKFYTKKF